ncbi:MAG: hypothetical protein O7C75_21270 [Verrucomicrobia bacterium]|nr:hypothetical protein [Verrucomicrobiota bacterium]
MTQAIRCLNVSGRSFFIRLGATKTFDIFLLRLIGASVAVVMLESVESINQDRGLLLKIFE